eukprot:m.341898 g.341898  ORF g.341898 m.341898 type:complete len:339 (-) comp20659_c0_seq1:142-1158(-)
MSAQRHSLPDGAKAKGMQIKNLMLSRMRSKSLILPGECLSSLPLCEESDFAFGFPPSPTDLGIDGGSHITQPTSASESSDDDEGYSSPYAIRRKALSTVGKQTPKSPTFSKSPSTTADFSPKSQNFSDNESDVILKEEETLKVFDLEKIKHDDAALDLIICSTNVNFVEEYFDMHDGTVDEIGKRDMETIKSVIKPLHRSPSSWILHRDTTTEEWERKEEELCNSEQFFPFTTAERSFILDLGPVEPNYSSSRQEWKRLGTFRRDGRPLSLPGSRLPPWSVTCGGRFFAPMPGAHLSPQAFRRQTRWDLMSSNSTYPKPAKMLRPIKEDVESWMFGVW